MHHIFHIQHVPSMLSTYIKMWGFNFAISVPILIEFGERSKWIKMFSRWWWWSGVACIVDGGKVIKGIFHQNIIST